MCVCARPNTSDLYIYRVFNTTPLKNNFDFWHFFCKLLGNLGSDREVLGDVLGGIFEVLSGEFREDSGYEKPIKQLSKNLSTPIKT